MQTGQEKLKCSRVILADNENLSGRLSAQCSMRNDESTLSTRTQQCPLQAACDSGRKKDIDSLTQGTITLVNPLVSMDFGKDCLIVIHRCIRMRLGFDHVSTNAS